MDQQAAKRRPCYRVFYSRFLPSFQNMNLSLAALVKKLYISTNHIAGIGVTEIASV